LAARAVAIPPTEDARRWFVGREGVSLGVKLWWCVSCVVCLWSGSEGQGTALNIRWEAAWRYVVVSAVEV
jgi:hypothetical protein